MFKQERGAHMEEERKPWLMYVSGEAQNNLTFCSISYPTKSYSRRIPEHWRLCTVQHGWFLWDNMRSKYGSNLFLWNPLNLKKIILPPLKHYCTNTKFGNWILSSPPTTNDEICSIFLISSYGPLIFYYQLGDNYWTQLCSYDDIMKALALKGNAPLRGKYTYFEDAAYCNGRLYAGMWTQLGFFIVVIKKHQPNGFSVKATSHILATYLPPKLICYFEQQIRHLIGYNNVLYKIEVLHALDKVVAVFVCKFDCSQRVWEKVESIKDKVFFISNINNSVFACQAINPEIKGGHIYIALNNCNFFYIYNVEDKSLATSHYFSNLSTKRSYSRWFMLDTGMSDTLKEEIGKAHQFRERESIYDVVHSKDIEDEAHNGLSLLQDVIEVIAKCINNVLDCLHFRASNKLLRLATPQIQWRSSSSMSMLRMTGTLREEIGKAHQFRERESICDVVYSKDTEDEVHNGLLSLPQDVIEVIAKCINNVLDYLQFRASNKLLRLATPHIQWRSSSSMSMSRFDDLSMCPLFVFSEKDRVFNFVHPKHGLKYKSIIKFPQALHRNLNLQICCSKDGWLLLVAAYQGYQSFFNPFTKEVLQLPSGNQGIFNIRCFNMSHSPTSYECVAVELVKTNNTTTAYVHHLLEGHRRRIKFEDKKFPLFNTSPAFHNGLFYFLSVTGKLAVIEVTREEISWKVLEEPQAPCSSHFNNFLVECDGNLLSVFESPFAKGVQVFKLDEDIMTWVKVESLKYHMLFVGKTSFSAVANISGMENKIYFNRFYGHSIVFYSLKTNNYHTFENDEVVNFHHVREQLDGTWMQPRWH